jgi:thiol-disulfide isomerase/thioredoxin
MKCFLAVTVLALGLTTPVMAQPQAGSASSASIAPGPSLAVGDPCPSLAFEKLLKGGPVGELEKGKVYVVEFWASWCAPCIQGIPHLSALQARYKDRVTIIGVNVRELRRVKEGYEESFDDETRAKVEDFVRRQGDRMAYTVVYDGAAKAMDTAWMKASGNEALPTAFIVDRTGTIAWIGHPTVLRMPLSEIVEGTWDTATGPQRVKQAEEAYLGAMRLFASDSEAGLLAWERAAGDYPLLASDLIGPKFHALLAAGQFDAAYAEGETLVAEATRTRSPGTLNEVAWAIVNTDAPVATSGLDLALRAATSASDLTEGKDPSILDTLARVYFYRSEIEKAIEFQARAVEAADEPARARLAATLDEYRKSRK